MIIEVLYQVLLHGRPSYVFFGHMSSTRHCSLSDFFLSLFTVERDYTLGPLTHTATIELTSYSITACITSSTSILHNCHIETDRVCKAPSPQAITVVVPLRI